MTTTTIEIDSDRVALVKMALLQVIQSGERIDKQLRDVLNTLQLLSGLLNGVLGAVEQLEAATTISSEAKKNPVEY